MKLDLQDFRTIVANSATAAQEASPQILDLRTGSVFRAILEANASVALWMQWLLVRLLRNARAATSGGADLDSWMADFSFARLPATSARATVTFSRIDAGAIALVPVGTRVRTADGARASVVIADPTSSAWDIATQSFCLDPGDTAVDVPVEAEGPGTAWNVQARAITLISSVLAGVDAVSNALPASGGRDSEGDDDFRRRFVTFINSRSRATTMAIESAIDSIQQGLSHSILENVDTAGRASPGNFLIIVDDGSGGPSEALLTAVRAAVDGVRPIGSRFAVRAPVVIEVAVRVTIAFIQDADRSSVVAAVTTRVATYVNGLAVGASLPASRVAQLAYDASPFVTNVTSVTLNGGAADLHPDLFSVIRAASVAVIA